MKKCTLLLFLTAFGLFLLPTDTQAQRKKSDDSSKSVKEDFSSIPTNKKTQGTVTANGQKISYDAVAGTMPLLDREAKKDTTARMSYVAYFKNDEQDLSKRPVTFVYNGGPGSSTLWLHMGSFGPKRVMTDSTNHMGGAPYELQENEYNLLASSDLVFIDMPGTGFGRIKKGEESEYHGVDEDAAAFAQFIENFITEYNRWNSPKFLFGESYGTLRSAVVANVLQSQHSIDLNGIILLSQILDYANSVDGPKSHPGNNKPYQLALSTYAATACYHDKLPAKHSDLEFFLTEVEEFAMCDYGWALDQGAQLDETTKNEVADKLHEYTGLTTDYIKKANLRIEGGEFRQQLLLDEDGV